MKEEKEEWGKDEGGAGQATPQTTPQAAHGSCCPPFDFSKDKFEGKDCAECTDQDFKDFGIFENS